MGFWPDQKLGSVVSGMPPLRHINRSRRDLWIVWQWGRLVGLILTSCYLTKAKDLRVGLQKDITKMTPLPTKIQSRAAGQRAARSLVLAQL